MTNSLSRSLWEAYAAHPLARHEEALINLYLFISIHLYLMIGSPLFWRHQSLFPRELAADLSLPPSTQLVELICRHGPTGPSSCLQVTASLGLGGSCHQSVPRKTTRPAAVMTACHVFRRIRRSIQGPRASDSRNILGGKRKVRT